MGRSYYMPWRVWFPVVGALLLACIKGYGTTDLTGTTLVPAVDAGIDISADIDTLRESGQLVNVKWSGTHYKCNHCCERLSLVKGMFARVSRAVPCWQ
jgi:hypothetical protein